MDNVITAMTSDGMVAPSYWIDPKSGNNYMVTVQYANSWINNMSMEDFEKFRCVACVRPVTRRCRKLARRAISQASRFPRLDTVILDFFHVSEHLGELAKAWHGVGTEAAEKQHAEWAHQLKREGGEKMLARLRGLELPPRQSLREVWRATVTYFENQSHRMDYPKYVSKGWRIGSGPGTGVQDGDQPTPEEIGTALGFGRLGRGRSPESVILERTRAMECLLVER